MRFFLAAILLSISTATVVGDERDALCRDLSRQLVESVGLKFEKVAGIRPVYWFSSPHAEWVTIDCEDKWPMAIFSVASPFPSDEFYGLAGDVAQVVSGIRREVASHAFKQCQKKALDDPKSMRQVMAGKARLGCKASIDQGTMLSATMAD